MWHWIKRLAELIIALATIITSIDEAWCKLKKFFDDDEDPEDPED